VSLVALRDSLKLRLSDVVASAKGLSLRSQAPGSPFLLPHCWVSEDRCRQMRLAARECRSQRSANGSFLKKFHTKVAATEDR